MENKDIYIQDLLHDNNCYFAQNHGLKERKKELIRDLLNTINRLGNEEDIKKVASLTGHIFGINRVMKENNDSIKANIEKIEGLRHGTIKEI